MEMALPMVPTRDSGKYDGDGAWVVYLCFVLVNLITLHTNKILPLRHRQTNYDVVNTTRPKTTSDDLSLVVIFLLVSKF